MKLYAILNEDRFVTAVLMRDSEPEGGLWVEAVEGWDIGGYVAEDGTYTPPPPAPTPEPVYTWLNFMDLFTEAEQVELAGAAMTDPTMKLWYDRALGAQGILLSDERTIAGVNHAAEQGLITNSRRDAVLRGEAPDV